METRVFKPTFIVGSQRSGTTMFRLMLNNHPEIAVPHETAFITVFYRQLHKYGNLEEPQNIEKLLEDICQHPLVQRGTLISSKEAVLQHQPRNYTELVEAIFAEYRMRFGKKYWCDKTPFYTENIDLLHQVIPDARFIHLVRDGRDVSLSQKNISWLPSGIPTIAAQWKWKTMLCHKIGRVIGPDRFLEIKYEDLVLNTEATLRTVCEFLGVEYSHEMLHYSDTANSVVPEESIQWHKNSIKLPDASKVFAWRNRMSRSDRVIFEQIAGDALEAFGYEREALRPDLMSRAKKLYFAAFQRY